MLISPPPDAHDAVVGARREPRAAADEHGDDQVLRDGQQPPLHEHEPARQPLRVLDVERRRVVRLVGSANGG